MDTFVFDLSLTRCLKFYLFIGILSYLLIALYQKSFPIIKRVIAKDIFRGSKKESKIPKGKNRPGIWITKTILFWFYCLPYNNSKFIAAIFATSTPFLWFNEHILYRLPKKSIDSKDRIAHTIEKGEKSDENWAVLAIPPNNLMHMHELKRLISPHWFYILFMALWWVKCDCFL